MPSKLYSSSFHRFNTVGSSGGSTSNAAAMVGTAIGTASLPDIGDSFVLTDPTVIDNSGTTQTFSTEIANAGHTGYTIKGIQIQMYASCSVTTPFPDIRYQTKLSGDASFQEIIQLPSNAVAPFQPRRYPSDASPLSVFNLNLNTTNVDDLTLRVNYNSNPDSGDWFIHSENFTNNTPTPAMRIWYEATPKLTITTGKLNIISGKVSIA